MRPSSSPTNWGHLKVVLQKPEAELVWCIVIRKRPALFRGRHFQGAIILLCVRWYLRYSLAYRDLEEIMAERVFLSTI
jgi:hypothetical protein